LYVALAILLALLALLVLAARQKQTAVRAYATFHVTKDACFLNQKERLNVTRCVPVRANVYLLEFSRSVAQSVPIVSGSTCCPIRIGAAVVSENGVEVAFAGNPRYPIEASLLMP
jgi:hypothetical protein